MSDRAVMVIMSVWFVLLLVLGLTLFPESLSTY